MSETKRHKMLKRTVIASLEAAGYDTATEKQHGKYRIDVVGKTEVSSIAVEVGTCSAEKIDNLREYYEEVVHIPYDEHEKWDNTKENNRKRTTVYLNSDDWEKFKEVVDGKASSQVRKMMRAFLELCEEGCMS